MPLGAPVGFLYWYTTSIILGILTFLNIITQLYRFISRPRSTASTSFTTLPAPVTSQLALSRSTFEGTEAEKPEVPQLSRLARIARVLWVLAEKYVILTALPLPKLRWWIKRKTKPSVATTELVWQGGYVLGVLVLSFWGGQ